ncbi:hypothetical protein RhiirA1_539860 [Rhizophagus irregularis]|uniref:Uncharacterized protein n=3 Tax=Rhizophagus irregularis TaxID=588596 RepID=A0A2I1FAV6_9GLOM|nr:hypothetical protein GLOIN_2v1768141 [Rhizophagus irregularis DAOM 181602=DAOM 197198]EXX62250.1 hypothetical protein RirG_163560 [Rhizophagus irregularis DAOM 197198w]PKC60398.1 hypothetical protein RhiirA1_539860 [Rhizophagus irregularis]PKY31477.1 hypothetical protein RhiirB3_449101 [Rhizophagus irregularis]POG77117.1 hypothetical protein GLOIN_2v1768141 [Rhizophagus irregularis DAOM 181602=DAOM 197198]UZO27004.1 hypothetical protein OCT59_019213 [Rhizophagus irregularis]|eukprot:XP_025183983.1 hypothetical protein GLOIN_2v1768141 [Rhizophagus irregularis DAOM 181602=DAOM 197198]
MAFSKILPELLDEILQYFHQDYKTLYSCILVNRLWCNLAIPLLWENPFSIEFPKNYHFIEIYLYNLNDDDKTKLIQYGMNKDLFPLNTLFKYPSFIKHLDINKISKSIEYWEVTIRTSETNNNLQNSNFIKLICKSLIQIFIENEVNLYSLKVLLGSFDDIFELILQNSNFIGNIKKLKLDLLKISESSTKFLTFLSSNCNSISSLSQSFQYYNDYKHQQIMENSLSQIINSQKNLRKILFRSNKFPLYQSLLSLKNPNCSNTLNTIIFYHINFENIIILNEVFNQLNVLESIHIINCHCIDTKFVQQIINITKPFKFKLKSLILRKVPQFEPLDLLLQHFGCYLENLGIFVENKPQSSQLFKSVTKYCSKIKFLLLGLGINYQNINLVFNLIDNIKQSLNCLVIDVTIDNNDNNNFSSIILQNLGQILPFKLDYLNLCLSINESDLEIFLKNSQNTFIKKLLIKIKRKEKYVDIYPYIKEYIMKKKRVKYLAISEISDKKNWFSLKDIVKEFKLYDIQILDYYILRNDIDSINDILEVFKE